MKTNYSKFNFLIRQERLKSYFTTLFICMSLVVFSQNTIYVNSITGNDTSGDGSSGNPFKSFHKGYTAAISGDILNLSGIFDWTDTNETGDASISGYTLAKNLTIQGQGANATFIQAASSENSADRRVFTATNSATFNSLTINGITIRNGVSSSDGNTSAGLLILTTTSNHNFVLNVNDCSFENNHIISFSSENGFSGAALAFSGYAYGTLDINKTTFKNNSAYIRSYGAGALYINQSVNANIMSCTFNGNTGRSNFSGNYYGTSGALYAYRNSINKIANCTFSNNNSDGNGGAIILHQNSTYLTNTTIAGNTVTSASGKGGGILVDSQTNTYFKNNLIANNTVNGSSNDFYSGAGTTTSNGYNIVESSIGYVFGATGDITGDQADLFGTGISSSPALANNNSTNGTQTLALSSGSIAINAGDNAINGIVSVPSEDQRGAARIGNVDIGSYEFGGTLASSKWVDTSHLKLYPTISSGIIHITDNKPYQYKLYNALGQEIKSGIAKGEIHITKHTKGLYVIKLHTANSYNTFKVILK